MDERARAISARVWSPYCPGRLLVDCTTPQARELRTDIADRLEAGQSEDGVVAWIRAEHGDAALARPSARGAGLAMWLTPAAIFAAGAILVGGLIRRWRRTPAEGDGSPPDPPSRRPVQVDRPSQTDPDEALRWLRAQVDLES